MLTLSELFQSTIEKQIMLTLSEQFQSPIEKWKNNNATLSEQFQSLIENQIMPHCQNCSGSVALLVYLLDIGNGQKVWHYWFFYGTLELFWQCGIICFYMRIWNCSDSVALFVFIFLFDFGTVPKSNRKTNNATLSEQLQRPIEKPIMPHFLVISNVQ